MTANNFRINNYVGCKTSNDAGIYQVGGIDGWARTVAENSKELFTDERLIRLVGGARDNEFYKESRIRGIKITGQWFEELGFSKSICEDVTIYELMVNGVLFISGDKNGYLECVVDLPTKKQIRLRYIHDIQNWHFLLTGNEIEIK